MDAEQPYRPPQADVSGPPAGPTGSGNVITHEMVEHMNRTRPWVLLVGVMTLIACVFLVLLAGFMALAGSFTDLGPVGGMAMGILYGLFAFLYFFPGLYLLRYAGAIKKMGGQADGAAMGIALKHQLSFWRFVGILTLASVVIYALIIVVAIIAGILGAAAG